MALKNYLVRILSEALRIDIALFQREVVAVNKEDFQMKRLTYILSSSLLLCGAAASAQEPPSSELACRRAIALCADGAYRNKGFRTSGECFDYYTMGLDCPQPGDPEEEDYVYYWNPKAVPGCGSRIGCN